MASNKVLHLTDCKVGGVPAVIDLLLRNIGGKTIFIGDKSNIIGDEYLIKTDSKLKRSLNPYFVIKNYLGLYCAIKTYNPELIHAHSAFAGVYGAFLSLHFKIPLVYTPHASPAMIPDASIFMRVITQFEKITINLSRKIIACSPDEANILKKNTSKSNLIEVIPNGVENIYKHNENIKLDVVAVGRICNQKRPDLFIDIAEKLVSINSNVKIGWIGPGVAIKNNANIKWYSELSEEKVEDILNHSKIFLSTSNYEGLSLAALKASVAGCYLILRNTSGTRAPVKFGSDGYIFDSIDDAANKINSIIMNEKLNRIDERRRRAITNFNIFRLEKQILSHQDLYKEVLAHGN